MDTSRHCSRSRGSRHQAAGCSGAVHTGFTRDHRGSSRRWSSSPRHCASTGGSSLGSTNPAEHSTAASEAIGGATSVDRKSRSCPYQRATTAVYLVSWKPRTSRSAPSRISRSPARSSPPTSRPHFTQTAHITSIAALCPSRYSRIISRMNGVAA